MNDREKFESAFFDASGFNDVLDAEMAFKLKDDQYVNDIVKLCESLWLAAKEEYRSIESAYNVIVNHFISMPDAKNYLLQNISTDNELYPEVQVEVRKAQSTTAQERVIELKEVLEQIADEARSFEHRKGKKVSWLERAEKVLNSPKEQK